MRVHGETQACRNTICGIVYQWHTVVQGPDNCEHAAAAGPCMRFMQQFWSRGDALDLYKNSHFYIFAACKNMQQMGVTTPPEAASEALGHAYFARFQTQFFFHKWVSNWSYYDYIRIMIFKKI